MIPLIMPQPIPTRKSKITESQFLFNDERLQGLLRILFLVNCICNV